MARGEPLAFTPDGPRGPLREVQPGVLYVAQKTGRPILPIAVGAKRSWIFKGSWDEFMVPKPFNRIVMVYGKPLHVNPADDPDVMATRLKEALDVVSQEADHIARP